MVIDLMPLRRWCKDQRLGQIQGQVFCDQVSIDSRTITSPNTLFVALVGTRTDGHRFLLDAENKGAHFALVNKSLQIEPKFRRLELIPVEDPLRALQFLAHHHRMAHGAKILAICGSSGKTEIKDLLFHIFKVGFRSRCSAESYNSQIGVALSLLKIQPQDELMIVECGISTLGEMQILADLVCPDYALLTNIEPKHIQTLGSLTAICSEKSRLLRAVPKAGWAILPQHASDILTQAGVKIPSHWKIWDGPNNGRFAPSVRIGDQLALAALTAAQLMGVAQKTVAKRLMSYRSQKMRLEMWRTFAGPIVINDLYCADLATLSKTLDFARLFARESSRKILWFEGVKDQRIKGKYQMIDQLTEQFAIDEVNFDQFRAKLMTNCTFTPAILPFKEGDLLIFRGAKKRNFRQIAHQMRTPFPPATLTVDLTAVAHNVRLIRKTIGPKITIMAMLKARAYGTDEEIMARFLMRCGINYFGLATVDEAIALRRAGIFCPLIVLHASPMQWDLAVESDLQICVSKKREIENLARCALRAKKRVKLHLHVDTGMCRLGCHQTQALTLAKMIAGHSHLELEGIMGHFASADEPSQINFTKEQVAIFEALLVSLLEAGIDFRYSHLANSAGALSGQNSSCNLIRIGLALFGLTSPALHPHLLLRPALSLQADIAHLHTIQRGQSVSYGRKYRAWREKEQIAVIPLGYADGLRRDFGKICAVVKGQMAPIVGAICMDFTMCDVTHIQGVRVGDSAMLFGQDDLSSSSPHRFAEEMGISVHEVIATLGPRIQRLFCFDQKPLVT